MARTRISDITIQKNGRFRARSRINQYPPDSRVFDTRKEALEWKTDADSKKLAGVYESRREAEDTTLREALEAYRNEIADKKKGKTRINAVNHLNQLIGDRISQYSLAVLSIKYLREFKLRRLDQDNPRRPEEKISTSTVRRDLLKISAVFNWYRDEHGLDSLVNPLTGRRNFMPREADHRERRLVADADPLKDEESRLIAAARDYSTGEYAFLIREQMVPA